MKTSRVLKNLALFVLCVSAPILAGCGPTTVPNVVGMAQSAALSALANARLAAGTLTEERSDTIPAGRVISQNPQAGASVDEGTAVDLAVSRGASEFDMVTVPEGTFTMGNSGVDDDLTYGGADELPVHPVTLAAYQIGKHCVTNRQYCDVLNWALAQGHLKSLDGTAWAGAGDVCAGGDLRSILLLTDPFCDIQFSDGVFSSKTRVGLPGTTNYSMDTHPAADVTWLGAAACCNWLSEIEGLTPCYDMTAAGWPLTVAPPAPGGYRLPTEAEWERAAAWDGAKHWIYGFTSDINMWSARCNYYWSFHGRSDYVNPLGLTAQPYTSPVGWFNGVNVSPNGNVKTVNSASPAGCHSMSGEVNEWCGDWYGAYSGEAQTNPTGPAAGVYRVFRGGSWAAPAGGCRSACRNSTVPTFAGYDLGFRLASSPATVVTSFAINGGDATTANAAVMLNNSATNGPTEYMAAESATFAGAAWTAYEMAPPFTLSGGTGIRTVYFKTRNAGGESPVVSDSITLTPELETVMLSGNVPLEMVWIPEGAFVMGSPDTEQERQRDEGAQHTVTLGGFRLGKYEVTKLQWTAVMGTAPWVGQDFVLADVESPAVYVSWDHAQAFIAKLNAVTGRAFRLASEAEWEYACRAGTTTRFYWGGDPSLTAIYDYAWFDRNAWDANQQYAHLVGQKLKNPFGLYDTIGNVSEWCEDDYHGNYSGAPTNGNAWIDSPRGGERIIRGGTAFFDVAVIGCRSASRFSWPPSTTRADLGFRLAGS